MIHSTIFIQFVYTHCVLHRHTLDESVSFEKFGDAVWYPTNDLISMMGCHHATIKIHYMQPQ